jgi:DNA-binding response OmpR family regulator
MGILDQLRSLLQKRHDTPATTLQIPDETLSGYDPTTERRRRTRLNPRPGTRALIIDDSPTIVAALRKILRSSGIETLQALTAEVGLEIAFREKPDLIFLDIILPGMNGFAALRQMRRDARTGNIPIIMISGNEQATEQYYASRIGADDFMKKPFSRHEVFARIELLLDENLAVKRPPPLRDPVNAAAPAANTPPAETAP